MEILINICGKEGKKASIKMSASFDLNEISSDRGDFINFSCESLKLFANASSYCERKKSTKQSSFEVEPGEVKKRTNLKATRISSLGNDKLSLKRLSAN